MTDSVTQRACVWRARSVSKRVPEGKASIEELPADDKVEAINHLEWIKATLTKADNERLVCERVKVVGSNRPQRVCRTVAEMRAARQEAERSLETRLMCGQGCRGN